MIPQFLLLAFIGAFAGGQINRAIYRLAWYKRSISPWSPPPGHETLRTWQDCLPIWGWWTLRREHPIHGSGFWLRPMMLELFCAIALPAFYWWHVTGQLQPIGIVPPLGFLWTELFVRHAILFALMLVATFIDLDEQTIPDEITVPGTLAGLGLAIVWPMAMLPIATPGPAGGAEIDRLLATDPNVWSLWLNTRSGLWVGWAAFTGWCLALLPYTVTLRKGWVKGVRFFFAKPVRFVLHAWWGRLLALMWVAGSAILVLVWNRAVANPLAIEPWRSLLTSLIGLAFGGGMVWGVRIVAGNVLGKEAMGFGDVTLMAMIGVFVGWQPSLIVFFIAPFAGLFIAVSHYLLSGRHDIAFGPYLCFGAAVVVVFWREVWERWGPIFSLGWFIPITVGVCVLLMGAMLLVWRALQQLFLP